MLKLLSAKLLWFETLLCIFTLISQCYYLQYTIWLTIAFRFGKNILMLLIQTDNSIWSLLHSAWLKINGIWSFEPLNSWKHECCQVHHATPYFLSCSFSQCLVEVYRNRRSMLPYGLMWLAKDFPARSIQPCNAPGSLNRVPASAGIKAGKSPLPGSR